MRQCIGIAISTFSTMVDGELEGLQGTALLSKSIVAGIRGKR